ncbi:heparan-alpha-glucosaminide N-acetyltransferase [Comamonas sp.]|uniref:heparan-alpha-glucosaminide N-acetyltransferase n=1 Tax=Comamonas sp. TaxID=34028 RepID=UPI00289AEAFB|nr:heparan-alpha-glucosaminide N-acetyltransferase [Comamonas sp.]
MPTQFHPVTYAQSEPRAPRDRWDRLDALRGLAMVWMTAFHFCFDLSYLQLWRQDFYRNPVWTWQRTAIVSLFLLCAGLAQAAAHSKQTSAARFCRRWLQVAGCALLVSAGSYLVFPNSYIYFGVLHGMAVMLLLLRLMQGWSNRLLFSLAVLCLLAPGLYQYVASGLPASLVELLNAKAFSPLGLVTRKPATEDFVPLLPWLGIMLLGFQIGRHQIAKSGAWLPGYLARPAQNALCRSLAWLGRHSLSYYMLHQLVLMGGLMLLVLLLPTALD